MVRKFGPILQEIASELWNAGTCGRCQWCYRFKPSRQLQEGKRYRNTSRIDKLTLVRKFGPILQEITSQLWNAGTCSRRQWCYRFTSSRRLQEGKKYRNTSQIDGLS